MAQKVVGYVRFQVPAVKATPAPPVGPALGQYGVNIGQFTKDFNERTKGDMGLMIPVVITVYSDRSFTFITKTPPAALLIKKACGIETASGVPQRDKVATIMHRRKEEYLRVEPERHAVHVVDVVTEFLVPFERVAPVDLRPAGEARTHLVAAVLLRRVARQIADGQRARAYQRHVAL